MKFNKNKTWTKKDENFLLEQRREKVSYKHIAGILKRTEKACSQRYSQLTRNPTSFILKKEEPVQLKKKEVIIFSGKTKITIKEGNVTVEI